MAGKGGVKGQVQSKQVMSRDQRFASTGGEAMKRRGRLSARAYNKRPAKRPARAKRRVAKGAKADALDDLIGSNIASERREGAQAAQGARLAAKPSAAPAPAKKPKPVTTAKASRRSMSGGGKKKDASGQWLQLGYKAALAGKCSVAFDYFTRALSTKSSLAGQVADALGRCRSQLEGKGPHVWLASRVQAVERRRKARRKAAEKRRASKKAKAKQQAAPTTLK